VVDVILRNIVQKQNFRDFVDMGMFPYKNVNLKDLNRAWASLGGHEV